MKLVPRSGRQGSQWPQITYAAGAGGVGVGFRPPWADRHTRQGKKPSPDHWVWRGRAVVFAASEGQTAGAGSRRAPSGSQRDR